MFTIKETLKYGWTKFKENLELMLFTTLLILGVGSLTSGFGDPEKFDISLFGIIATIFFIIIRIGYTKIFLRINDGEKPRFVEIFQEYKTFWRYLGVSILFPLAVFGGLILLVIPGVFWAIRFSFSLFIVVDDKIGPIKAMKESWAITKGNFWKILWFWIVMGFANFLGLVCLGAGLVITVPVTTFASVYVYRKLSKTRASVIENPSPQAA